MASRRSLSTSGPTPTGSSLASLRAITDVRVVVRHKVEAQLKRLASRGPEAWQFEADFLREAQVPNPLKSHIPAEFSKYTAEVFLVGVNGTVKLMWFGDPKNAAIIAKEQKQQRPDREG